MTDDILASLEPSLGRRWLGVIAATALGGLLIWHGAFNMEARGISRGLVVVFGLACLWQAQWNLRVTSTGLVLTRAGIFDGQGRLITPLDNILEVDRGILSFKPSNGFLLRLRDPEPSGWAPGLYWRFGRRLGIGGATAPAQNKAMAEAIEVQIMERSLGPEIG